MARIAVVAALAAVAFAGCGGDDEQGPAGGRASTARAAPPADAAELVARADEAMRHDDFDGALALLRRAGTFPDAEERLPRYRAIAARTTLRVARKRYAETVRTKQPPQPALSLARNSLKYRETAEARRFYVRMQRELKAFQRKHGVKPNEDPGGPPPQAGGNGG
jgi:hypothetical protein